ncbi:MAG: methyltransferase domain-containing protein [Bacteroidetes bacterium]|nr:MAG: methyltransferase domain-containing protein [Bacteroidota bacterium]
MSETNKKDPIGAAIKEYSVRKKPADIVVASDICEDDIIPVEVLFRTYEEMPELEKMALEMCRGKVLDVGAGAGVHSEYLMEKGLKVEAIDTSEGAVEYMNSIGISARELNFFHVKEERYDTILMLMNGIGIAGKLSNLKNTLKHAWDLLESGGQLLCDSSDIRYLYEDEDGALWVDLNSEYYGNFRFQMQYKKEKGKWFDWLYVDFDTLFKEAKEVGFKTSRLEVNGDHYLAKLEKV